MKTIFSFFYCLIVFTVFVWLLFKPSSERVKEVVKTDTIPGDSIPYPVYVPVPVPVDSIVKDTVRIPVLVDTAEILKHYFAKYFYTDTIRDTSFVAILSEVITQNKIADRKLYVQNLRSQSVTNNITIANPAARLYIGPSLTYNRDIGFGVGGIWFNQNHALGMNIDVTNRVVGVSYFLTFKIKNQ